MFRSIAFLVYAQQTQRKDSDVSLVLLTNCPIMCYSEVDRAVSQTRRNLSLCQDDRSGCYDVIQKEEDHDGSLVTYREHFTLVDASGNEFSSLHALLVVYTVQASRPSSTLVLLVEIHEKRKSLLDVRYGQ